MTIKLTITYTVADVDGGEFTGPACSAEIDLDMAVDAFQGESAEDITDAALEEYIGEYVASAFNAQIDPVVDTDHMAEAVKTLRATIEKARTS